MSIGSAPGHPEIVRVLAPNASAMTLAGTNTYVVGTDEGAYVIDPGPAAADHVEAIRDVASSWGGIAAVLLTHSHLDHSESVPMLDAELLWGTVGSGDEEHPGSGAEPAGRGSERRSDDRVGPFGVIPTPGHAVDHVCFMLGSVCFAGDLVLGRGSSFVPPDGGSLIAYLDSLRRVLELEPELLCPGHGPYVSEPAATLRSYIDHRLDRERKLVAALDAGERSRERLVELAWDDVPSELRPVAEVVMQAHLEKLDSEGRLPLDFAAGG